MEQAHPILSFKPEPKKEYIELAGGFVLELHEILAGNELQRLDDRRAARKKARVVTQAETRVNITAEEVDYYSWVEASCKRIFRDAKVEGSGVRGELALESFDPQNPCFPYLDVVRASAMQKDRLAAAGEAAWALTTGIDLEELKKGASPILTSEQEVSARENSDSSVSTSESALTPPQSEDSQSEPSTTSPTPELQTVS